MERANAMPRKRFFIDMFTRDISLADCILDLIDNSIDGLIRSNRLPMSDVLKLQETQQAPKSSIPNVKLSLSSRSFSIVDNCGGIPYNSAKDEVFNFGHPFDYQPLENEQTGLGVYGVGLKRAIFKLGDSFKIESQAQSSGFVTEVESLRDWVKKDEELEDWSFPIQKTAGAESKRAEGTKLVVKNLREEVSSLLDDQAFLGQLSSDIGKVFAFFLEKFVRVYINGNAVIPMPIAFGKSDEVSPAFKHFQIGKVDVYLYASLQMRDENQEWRAESAGWYVACNGRLIVVANKEALTGWGGGALPQYHSKYRGFLGLAHFVSNDPYLLPWTTTKRSLNRESLAYQRAMNEMRAIARPVISFLVRMYASDPAEVQPERQVADGVRKAEVSEIGQGIESAFQVRHTTPKKAKTTVRVQYDAEQSDLAKVRKHLRNPNLKANQIGKLTFDEYLKGLK